MKEFLAATHDGAAASTREPDRIDRRERGVTPRVVVLCLALAVAFGYALPVIDYKLNNTFLGASHLPPGAIGVLLTLALVVNPLLRFFGKSLSRNEALTVYITCLFSSLVPGHGSENFLVPNLLAPFYFATPENKWLTLLQPHLKPWLMPALNANGSVNRTVVEGWYVGSNGVVPWSAWLIPLAFWCSVVLISYAMLGCLSVMLRAQWAEKEALAFPLLKLPLEMTRDLDGKTEGNARVLASFFRIPMMWCGFGVAVFIQGLRGLHLYFPDVPDFPLDINMGPLFSEAPWNQLGWVPVSIYPMAVGVTFLLSSEVSFSMWFFYWFFKFQYVVAYSIGFPVGTLPGADGLPDKVFTGYQQFGCYIVYVGLVLWTARAHLKHVVQRAFGRAASTRAEESELMSYPLAFWGFVVSFALMVGASCLAGVRVDVALVLWLSYLILAIGLTRIAVEGGILLLQHRTSPLAAIGKLFGNGGGEWLSFDHGLAPAGFFQAGMVNHMRGFIMPSFVHSFKLAHDHKIAPKPLAALIVATILISFVVSWWTAIHLGYDHGGLSLGHHWWAQEGPKMPADFISSMMRPDNSSAPTRWVWMIAGGALTYLMMLARSRFAFFPFHPIGYLMGLTYPGAMFWASIFLGWLAKTIITRFGGNDAYRKFVPAFLGLILGDVTMMLFWLVIDGWQGRTGHLLLPG